ncbi:hypothetical protein BJ741DRAFT_331692 [Chytriomyces cf. hyalinus JEL632]|nr:hypothetical protein BJ741DRAFT_331692 [Chytriomyces cf. hyalinus JEL632]
MKDMKPKHVSKSLKFRDSRTAAATATGMSAIQRTSRGRFGKPLRANAGPAPCPKHFGNDVLTEGCVLPLAAEGKAAQLQSRPPLTVSRSQRKAFLNMDFEEIIEIPSPCGASPASDTKKEAPKADVQPPLHHSADAQHGGIRVREVVCFGVKVMRRKRSGLINANQILKAAGISADRAERLLNRLKVYSGVKPVTVTTGDALLHGQWFPETECKNLAESCKVFSLLAPLFDE